MLQGFAIVVFFIAVWAVGTFVQYRYWQRVRKLIYGYADEHVGHLGTGMCKVSFSRKAFVLLLTDEDGIVTGCYELKGLSLRPAFEPMAGVRGLHVDEVLDHLPDEKYRDAFRQALHAIDSSLRPEKNARNAIDEKTDRPAQAARRS